MVWVLQLGNHYWWFHHHHFENQILLIGALFLARLTRAPLSLCLIKLDISTVKDFSSLSVIESIPLGFTSIAQYPVV